MGLKRIIERTALGLEPEAREEIAERITKQRNAKAYKQLARQAIYLQLLIYSKVEKLQAYENRKLIKAGKRESCKQRKRRLRKEYLAKKK